MNRRVAERDLNVLPVFWTECMVKVIQRDGEGRKKGQLVKTIYLAGI